MRMDVEIRYLFSEVARVIPVHEKAEPRGKCLKFYASFCFS